MKHLKMFGLLVVAAASMMSFAGIASAANTLTSPVGTNLAVGSTIHLTLEKGTSLVITVSVETTCTESTMHGLINSNNTTHAEAPLTSTGTPPTGLSFGGCTKHTKVIKPGSLTLSDTGTAFLVGTRIEIIDTALGVTCFVGADATPVDIGKLTGGSPATLDLNTTELKSSKAAISSVIPKHLRPAATLSQICQRP